MTPDTMILQTFALFDHLQDDVSLKIITNRKHFAYHAQHYILDEGMKSLRWQGSSWKLVQYTMFVLPGLCFFSDS